MADMAAFYKLLLVRAPKLLTNQLVRFVYAARGRGMFNKLLLVRTPKLLTNRLVRFCYAAGGECLTSSYWSEPQSF